MFSRKHSGLMVMLFLLSLLGSAQNSYGGVDQIKSNIELYQDLAQQYEEAAEQMDKSVGEVREDKTLDIRGHTCGVLGELLGLGSDVAGGWTYPDPGIDAADPQHLRLYSVSLRHYAKVAQALLRENDFAWRYRWNLNCSGKYNSAKWFNFGDSESFALFISEDEKTVQIVGSIRPGLYDALAKRLTIHRSIERVELSSFGGLVHEAIKIGTLLRKRELTTIVRDNCKSACTLVFIGGSERIVPAPYYDLGFHRATERGGPVWDGDVIYEDIRRYAELMISQGDRFVELVQSGRGWDFHRPDAKELCEIGLATWVEDVCGDPLSD
jgi:hypothetical protein